MRHCLAPVLYASIVDPSIGLQNSAVPWRVAPCRNRYGSPHRESVHYRAGICSTNRCVCAPPGRRCVHRKMRTGYANERGVHRGLHRCLVVHVFTRFQVVFNLAKDPRVALCGTANHHGIRRSVIEHIFGVFRGADIAIGYHRDGYRRFNRRDGVILSVSFIFVSAGPPVNGQCLNACVLCNFAMTTPLRRLRSGPVRIFKVTGTDTASTTVLRIRATRSSSLSSAEPASALHTRLAGQPILMSIICAPLSTLWRAALASISGSARQSARCAAPLHRCDSSAAGSAQNPRAVHWQPPFRDGHPRAQGFG